jgi:hypothetical protein
MASSAHPWYQLLNIEDKHYILNSSEKTNIMSKEFGVLACTCWWWTHSTCDESEPGGGVWVQETGSHSHSPISRRGSTDRSGGVRPEPERAQTKRGRTQTLRSMSRSTRRGSLERRQCSGLVRRDICWHDRTSRDCAPDCDERCQSTARASRRASRRTAHYQHTDVQRLLRAVPDSITMQRDNAEVNIVQFLPLKRGFR